MTSSAPSTSTSRRTPSTSRRTPSTSHRTQPLRAVTDSDRPVGRATQPAPPRTSATQFSECVRVIVTLARRRGLRPPTFRSPPRIDGVDRSIQRRRNGSVLVAIRREDRPFAAIQGDVIEGVVAANRLHGEPADHFRRAAWSALEGSGDGRPPERSRSGAPQTVGERPVSERSIDRVA